MLCKESKASAFSAALAIDISAMCAELIVECVEEIVYWRAFEAFVFRKRGGTLAKITP